MSARVWDLGLGITLTAVGLAFVAGGWGMPPGVGGIPGPGFFPILVGGALTLLGCTLAASARSAHGLLWEGGWHHAPTRQVLAIVALLAAYAAVWHVVPFLVRTPPLLLAILRVSGGGWLRASVVAVVTTGVLAVVFDVLLRVRL